MGNERGVCRLVEGGAHDELFRQEPLRIVGALNWRRLVRLEVVEAVVQRQ